MNLNINKIFGPKLGGYTFQESGNFFMDNIIYFHNLVLCVLFFILILVTWFLVKTLLYFGHQSLTQDLSVSLKRNLNLFLYVIDYFIFYFNIIFKFSKKLYLKLSKTGQIFDGKFFTDKNFILIFIKTFYNSINIILATPYVVGLYIDYNLNIKHIDLKSFLKNHNIEYRYYFYADVKLEFIWTLFPSIVLLILAIPSFGLLFSIEKTSAPELTVKIIGHQWYWEYQYMDYINFKQIIINDLYKFIYTSKNDDNYILESYMINDEDLAKGQFRLLEVDKKLVLPINTSIRLLITSDDVLHSWAVPSLGIKVDACPGRINELTIKIRDIGLFYGQCSELCGWYHGFMPIVIQTLNSNEFKIWALSSFLDVKYTTNGTKF